MFKKKKKDKQRGQAEKNQKNLAKNNGQQDSSIIQNFDNTDGFDDDGFVDLQPIESDSTVLGPRQRCMYVGTFAVVSGTDGRNTLKTHKERTSFVKDHLILYRNKRNGVNVMLQMSSDGIKVFNEDASRVRMAYPLQRISFATCDPDFCLFAFMTYSPTPEGVTVHGHVFFGQSPKQVQDITAMVGKAFKLAFASSKLKKPGMNTGDIVPDPQRPVRRWAKHELNRGHESSEHAAFAKDKKKALQAKSSNSSTGSGNEGSPILERKTPTAMKPGWRNGSPAMTPPNQRKLKGLSLGSRFCGDDDAVCDSLSEMSVSNTSTKEPLASGVTASEMRDSSCGRVSSPPSSPERMPGALNASGGPTGEDMLTSTPSGPPPLPPRIQQATRKERSMSDPVSSTFMSGEFREAAPSLPTKVTYMGKDEDESEGNRKRADTNDRPATHHDEYWYMPGIPREFILEMLQSSEDGSFFVRDSQSRPGCHALTVRIPKDIVPDGFANYLINSIPEGIKLEGFSKTFPDLMTLIEHYSQNADELPCKLQLAGSNILCENENEDYTNMEPIDPDYRLLSDFHSMMDELKY